MLSFSPSELSAQVLNALLRREQWALDKVASQAGKTVQVNIAATSFAYQLQETGLLVALAPATLTSADLILTISRENLQAIVTQYPKDKTQLLNYLHLQGDVGLAQVVSTLAQDLRWDIRYELGQLIGDFPASIIMTALEQGVHLTRYVIQQAMQPIKEHLQNSPLLPTKADFIHLQQEIQSLLARLDRLDKRGK